MKLSIYPKSNSDKQDYHVFQLQITGIGKPIQYSTGEKIPNKDLKYWQNGAIIEKQSSTELYKLNAKFRRMKKVAEDAHNRGENIREALDRMKGIVKNKPTKISGFYDLLDNICIPGFKRDNDGNPLEKSSLKGYKTLRSLLKKFDPDQTYSFEDWTVTLWSQLYIWMESHRIRKSKTKGQAPNSIKSYCRLLKSVLNEGFERELTSVTPWKRKGFAAPGEATKKPWIKTAEWDRLYKIEMTGEQKLIRSYFICAAECGGIRLVDWHQMNPSNYVEDGEYIQFVPQKTKRHETTVRIYLTDRYKTIMADYGGALPPVPQRHRVLAGIKAMCAGIGIETPKGFGSHVARRSYINNQLVSGQSKTIVKTATGHVSDAFDGYINIDLIDSGKAQKKHALEIKRGRLKAV